MAEAQQQQTPAAAPPGVIPDDQDAPPAPVDVDIESGEVTPAAETPAPNTPADQTPQARSKPRPQARIQTLTHERDSWQGTAQRLEHELADARRQAAEAMLAREQAERAGMENLVQRTKAEVIAAKAALKQAKDSGDSDAEVEAQTRLARAAAEEADADAWVATQPKAGQQQTQQQQPQQQQRQQQPDVQPISGAVRDFISDNPWFSVVQMGSDGRPLTDQSGRLVQNPNYDEDMHDVALTEHKKIAREVRLGTLPKEFVESPEYFQRIASRVATEFPDAFEDGEEAPVVPAPRPRTPQMSPTKQPVAPTSRQIPGQSAPRAGSKTRLSGEEAELVRSLVDNGTMRYGRDAQDAAKRGQKMSYEDAYVKYARERKSDQDSRGNQNQQ